MYKILTAIFVLGASFSAAAKTGVATGAVDTVVIYNSGMILVTGLTFENAECTNNGGFVIPQDHPQADTLLGVIHTAKATGRAITVQAKIDGCWYPEVTNGGEMTMISYK